MTRRIQLLMCLAFAFILSTEAHAQVFHVVASRTAVVREQSNRDADAIVRLQRGESAICQTDPAGDRPLQVDGFYRIQLRDGRMGWVSRFVVRAHDGAPPEFIPPSSVNAVEAQARAFHLQVGAPVGYVELFNEGYVVGYDPRLRIPAWVQYRVTAQQLASDLPRSDAFAADTRVHARGRAELTDYDVAADWEIWEAMGLLPARNPNDRGPMYARGHMAPARDLAYDVDVEASSYLLTNMAPQVHAGFNSGIWSSLERKVREWAAVRGDLTVIMGPVFQTSAALIEPPVEEDDRLLLSSESVVFAQPPTERQVLYNVVGARDVAVPTAFFKIVIDMHTLDDPDVIAFVVPHYRNPDSRTSTQRLAEMLVSVDEIELLTGLDVLTDLDADVETRVESAPATGVWRSSR